MVGHWILLKFGCRRRAARPYARRDLTVPSGSSSTAATSCKGISSPKCRSRTARQAGVNSRSFRSAWTAPRSGATSVSSSSFGATVLRPAPLFFQKAKSRAAGDAEHLRAEQVGRRQPPELAIDNQQNLLIDVIGMKRADHTPDVAMQRRLNGAQEQLQPLVWYQSSPFNW